jgi:hypothetical protein
VPSASFVDTNDRAGIPAKSAVRGSGSAAFRIEKECAALMTDDVPFHAVSGNRSADDAEALRRARSQAAAALRGPRTVWLRPGSSVTPRPAGDERRAIRRALRDWESLSTESLLPSLTDLAPLRNPVDWADRFLLACDPDPARSVFVLCGSRVEKAFGQHIIGRTLGEVASRQNALLHACTDAVREQGPFEVEDAFRAGGEKLVFYRAVFMPVRGVDSDDTYLMGAYGCLAVPE